jgi:hypothetical protein
MHDWMHGICQGTMPISMYLVLEALQAAGCKSWSAMEEYFSFWVLLQLFICKKKVGSSQEIWEGQSTCQ